MSTETDAALRAAAEAATPGPWEVIWNAVAYVDTVADPSDRTGQTPMHEPVKVADAGERDREFIAAANPTAILDLLDEVVRLRAQVAAVEALAEELDGLSRSFAFAKRDAYEEAASRLRAALDIPSGEGADS